MRKIKLDVESLAALSFETATPESTDPPKLPDTNDTCWASCLSACGVCPDWPAGNR